MRFGVIGCGAIAEHHALAGTALPGCEMIACADVNRQSAERFADRHRAPRVFSDGRSLLQMDDLDLVVICTPPKWHAEFVFSALRHGKHVLVEKPMTTTLGEADAIVSAAAQTDRIVSTALVHRYLPVYHAARGLIEAGVLGAPRQIRLSLGRSMQSDTRFAAPDNDSRGWLVDCDIAGGGILMSSSIHFFSVVSYLLGDPVAQSVEGQVRQLHPAGFRRIEDDVDLVVRWDNHVDFNHRESWVADLPYRADMIGDEGRLTISGSDFTSLELRAECRRPLPAPYQALDEGRVMTNEILISLEPQNVLFSGLWADVVTSIERGSPVARLPDVWHARNMQAIVAACYQAASTGQTTTVHWLPRETAVTA